MVSTILDTIIGAILWGTADETLTSDSLPTPPQLPK
jgi:hypothetical protein